MHFINGKLILFDLETDGKDSEDAHLIEAALIQVIPGRPGSPRMEHVWLAQPTRPIPEEAVSVHGISTERATAEGRPRAEVLSEIMDQMALWGPDCPLIGTNVNYDLTVLDRALGRECGTALEIRGPVIDTFLLDKCVDCWRPGSRQLADTAAHYRIKLDRAHAAGADALAAGQIAWRMAVTRNWPQSRSGRADPLEVEARELIARGDAAALDVAQRRWFEVKQRELAAYFRTPKAVEKIHAKVAEGRMTPEQGEVAIAELPESAAKAEATAADGWPVRPRLIPVG